MTIETDEELLVRMKARLVSLALKKHPFMTTFSLGHYLNLNHLPENELNQELIRLGIKETPEWKALVSL